MCGITGFVRSAFPDADLSILRKMGQTISHRGPDANGEYLDDYMALGHQRLSIVDLSDAGSQPMISSNGRFVIVFNGEIYNFIELRLELERAGVQFRSRTDTEVILELYKIEGAACLKKMNGMFALAIWDCDKRNLFLARDRIGKKPLYYYHGGGDSIAFASELKALLQLKEIPRSLDRSALLDYMKYLHVPAPKSIYENIYKLLPGHYLSLTLGDSPIISEYWDVSFSNTLNISLDDATDELSSLIEKATARRMISDVPLGAFLSGGVDSSVIVGMMAKHAQERVKTCSIGFSDKKHDESTYARQVAGIFETDHREYLVEQNMVDTVKLLPKYFDEPFADSSAVPTYHVSRLARQFVTVALAGDGGDESFGGYDRYITEIIENTFRENVPKVVLSALNVLAGNGRYPLQKKLSTLITGAMTAPATGFYHTNSHITDNEMKLLLSPSMHDVWQGHDPSFYTHKYWDRVRDADHVTRMLYTELKSTLPDGILVKVDRMSMANSLEVRAPLLDYEVVEFAARLPSRWKIKNGDKKYILKKIARKTLPKTITDRKKQGFTVPLNNWFKHDLRDLVTTNLLQEEGMNDFFNLSYISDLYQRHLRGNQDYSTLMWMLLSFSLWWKEYVDTSSS